jgi:hypothetical protein
MLLTVRQVAEKLQAPPSTIKYWEARGIIPAAVRQGIRGDRKWREEDIARFLAEREGQGCPPTVTPPASSVAAPQSECAPQSKDSSDRPEIC